MSEERELPCPFCGGEASVNGGDDGRMFVECNDCAASSMCALSVKDDPGPMLIAAWNRRTPPPEVRRVCEEIEEQIERDENGLPTTIEAERYCRWLAELEGAFKHE